MATKYPPEATLRDVKDFPADLAYDQRTYYGRFRHFLSMTDPATLLTSPARLAASEALLKHVADKADDWESTRVIDYVDARKRVHAIVHPETQKPILLPFRFSAYVPMNFLNLCGMLHPSQQTPLRAMFWQFSNQTYNVGFNYCNGSGKDGLPLHELFTGYCVATMTACGLSYGLSKLAAPAEAAAASSSSSASSSTAKATAAAARSARQRFLQLIIPYTAVACANIANLAVIRFRDVVQGIPVQDVETGEYLCDGTPSPRAGRLAVAQVALSRVMIPVPLMLLPPIFLNYLFDPVKGVPFFAQRQKALFMPVNVATLVAVLTVALPLAIAVFPQQTVVPASWLEEPYQKATDSSGKPVQSVAFNKGL